MDWIKNNAKKIIIAVFVAVMILCGMSLDQIVALLKFL